MKKILLADDDPNLRVLVSATLEGSEYEIVEALDGPEALHLTRKLNPQLVVLDWMMPGMTGVEVASALRADPRVPRMPIILLTAKTQTTDRAAGLEAGANAYLTKPFSPLELLDTVEDLLSK
jgi:DNA-binding response OmpR family regulator